MVVLVCPSLLCLGFVGKKDRELLAENYSFVLANAAWVYVSGMFPLFEPRRERSVVSLTPRYIYIY